MAATLTYLAIRGGNQGPLFQIYSGHSFQAEAASVLTAAGLEDLIIKTMGRCMGEFSLLAIY